MANRLNLATSPYLQQHANNPVHWWEWSDAAFAEAKRRDTPIFLSIGYSACHWCHVMAHESFEDEKVADFLNENFISIKVDREERPDIDSIYMQATVALTGQGGWPMTVLLDHDARPFYAGTYFPPTPHHGLPSFMQLLTRWKIGIPPSPVTPSPVWICFKSARRSLGCSYDGTANLVSWRS